MVGDDVVCIQRRSALLRLLNHLANHQRPILDHPAACQITLGLVVRAVEYLCRILASVHRIIILLPSEADVSRLAMVVQRVDVARYAVEV